MSTKLIVISSRESVLCSTDISESNVSVSNAGLDAQLLRSDHGQPRHRYWDSEMGKWVQCLG